MSSKLFRSTCIPTSTNSQASKLNTSVVLPTNDEKNVVFEEKLALPMLPLVTRRNALADGLSIKETFSKKKGTTKVPSVASVVSGIIKKVKRKSSGNRPVFKSMDVDFDESEHFDTIDPVRRPTYKPEDFDEVDQLYNALLSLAKGNRQHTSFAVGDHQESFDNDCDSLDEGLLEMLKEPFDSDDDMDGFTYIGSEFSA